MFFFFALRGRINVMLDQGPDFDSRMRLDGETIVSPKPNEWSFELLLRSLVFGFLWCLRGLTTVIF